MKLFYRLKVGPKCMLDPLYVFMGYYVDNNV